MIANTCEVRVGRLMEITVDAGYGSAADVDAMIAMIGARFASLPPAATAVIAADWRGVHLMAPETSERAHAMLTARNPRIERSAILVSSLSSIELLQFIRIVREGQHPSRRIFDGTRPMLGWLGEVLTAAEGARLATFLARAMP